MQSDHPAAPHPLSGMLTHLRPIGTRLLQAFLRLAPNERNRLFILTLVIGVFCGLAAVAFHSAIPVAVLLSQRLIGAKVGTRKDHLVLLTVYPDSPASFPWNWMLCSVCRFSSKTVEYGSRPLRTLLSR
mgnify:CR=1 FL=1